MIKEDWSDQGGHKHMEEKTFGQQGNKAGCQHQRSQMSSGREHQRRHQLPANHGETTNSSENSPVVEQPKTKRF